MTHQTGHTAEAAFFPVGGHTESPLLARVATIGFWVGVSGQNQTQPWEVQSL